MNEITLSAPAKLNLYLDITGKDKNGFHLLETVMTTISLCDKVTIKRAESDIKVSCTDDKIPQNEGNICHKAAKIFFGAAKINGGAKISIEKNIPSGAGMGGGSSDAAAVLTGLNRLYGEPFSEEELLEIGVKVGADVPFCIAKGTKLCTGIGEKISGCPALENKLYLIVMPNFKCDTKQAYEKFDQDPIPPKNALDKFFSEFPSALYNVFEEIYKSEEISSIKKRLLENGAQSAALTGSGAAVFGVFNSPEKAEKAKNAFSGQYQIFLERSL